jgi:exopolyphosphatase / guanosine-5'-triphosphate,3'-diphosphate pyrophosphatase
VENHSKTQVPAPSSDVLKGANRPNVVRDAPGRIEYGRPTAIVDIGSNSVRLVAYEGEGRAPNHIFNEKVLCGLGKGVVTTGRLNDDAISKALTALRRFRLLCESMNVGEIHVLATAAARDARNGAEFLAAAEAAIGTPIELLSGAREAELSALGVVSSFFQPQGVVGDLGGGSLELIEVNGDSIGAGISLGLGGLALMDRSNKSIKTAAKIVRESLRKVPQLKALRGKNFYAVGGTWRALARLHMTQRNYPLNVMHNYVIPANEAVDFASLVERVETDALVSIDSVSSQRRPLLAYGAVVLDEIIRIAKPKQIVISAMGVREGLLYERLTDELRALDPLLCSARDLNLLRSRSPEHGEDLCRWTDGFFASAPMDEKPEEVRLRHAACLLADIGWRAHPDYRGELSLNTIAHAAFMGIDHPSRAFLALTSVYRHLGVQENVSVQLRSLVSTRMLDHARVLGAVMRVAYILSAAMPKVLPKTEILCIKDNLLLVLPPELADLASDRLHNRLRQLARLIGRNAMITIDDDNADR